MVSILYRIAIVTLITFLLGSGIDFLTGLEVSFGLDNLFHLRGIRTAPNEVVVVAMDEASESYLSVGQDLTRWRGFHADLIRQLERQGAALVVFDLQFISPNPDVDTKLAEAMRTADNVLVADCAQKFLRATEGFFGRDECSDVHKEPSVVKEGSDGVEISEQLVVMSTIFPAAEIADAALDHAPFFVVNDAENSVIRESWTYYDGLAETPSLPVVAWLHYLQISELIRFDSDKQSLTDWLTERRRECRPDVNPLHGVFRKAFVNEQQLRDIICGGSSRVLDFYGPPRTIRTESYSDVYQGKVNDLQGKVVFVGKANRLFSPGKMDFFLTPFTNTQSGRMAGVEIMATQFANLLENRFVESPYPPGLFLAVFGLIASGLLTRSAGIAGILASVVFGFAYAGIAFWSFSRSAFWLPLAVPLLIQLPITWLIALFWSRRDLLQERQRIITFVRHVFPQWLHFIPAAPGQWYPENTSDALTFERNVEGLCLATDIEGYTTLAAQHTPHEIWALLRNYYQVLGHPVSKHDGVIANIQGDAMMAIWIDSPATVQGYSACLAALEIEQAVERFNQLSTAGILPTRIGLHLGDMVLGSGESGGYRFYNPFGDTVNTASRIQSVNKYLGTQILASLSVVAGLNQIIYRRVGRFRVVGRQEPLELVEIVGKVTEIAKGKIRQYQQFELYLGLFQLGQWEQAANGLQNLLNDYGEDPPSRYYLERAFSFQHHPPEHWDGVITLEGK